MSTVKENPKATYKIPGSQLYVSRLSTLWQLFSRNSISKSRIGLVLRIIFFSTITTPFQWFQRLVLYFPLKKIDITKNGSPIFILGHWRSGTTHLHYTMAKDTRLGYIANIHTFFFNICMIGLAGVDKLLAPFTPNKRPQDNVEFGIIEPAEEEQIMSNITPLAGVNSFYFPKNRSYFNQFNLFEGISERKYKKWQKYYTYMLKVASRINKERRLVLKNPNNTARAKQLLELFPDAKFIYIHRNPYQVYLSTKHLHRTVLRDQSLQDISTDEEDDIILTNYRSIMKGYLDSKKHIPADQLVEIAFDDLGKENEIDIFQNIYQKFDLGNWENQKPVIQAYLDSKKNYKKNKFVPIPEHLVQRIQTECAFVFEEYGYSKEYKDDSL
jgi:hypothetical protein